MLRRGFFTSPAVNVMLFQASAEKSDPVCATHIAIRSPKPSSRRGPVAIGTAPRGVQKLPNSRPPPCGFHPTAARRHQRDQRARLRGREDVLDQLAELEPARVRPCQQRDQQRRRSTAPSTAKSRNRREMIGAIEVVVLGDPRNQSRRYSARTRRRRRRSFRSGSPGTASSRRETPRAARTLRADRHTVRRRAASSPPARRRRARRRASGRR